MTHNIIKTENYLLVVNDSEIKIGNYYLCRLSMKPKKYIGDEYFNTVDEKKIIAHLPLNNSPVLEGVDLLPPLEDEVEKLSADYTEEWCGKRKVDVYIHDAFKGGYNKAKEKYKYTEFDIIKAFEYGWNQRHYGIIDENELLKIQKRFIKSLQQPKMPVAFECEWTTKQMPEFHQDEPKTTTNSQGQTVLVGKYIY